MRYCSDKRINKLIVDLVNHGWSFFWGSKHGRVRCPQGEVTLTVPSSPSDYRAFMNFRRDLRRAIIKPEKIKCKN